MASGQAPTILVNCHNLNLPLFNLFWLDVNNHVIFAIGILVIFVDEVQSGDDKVSELAAVILEEVIDHPNVRLRGEQLEGFALHALTVGIDHEGVLSRVLGVLAHHGEGLVHRLLGVERRLLVRRLPVVVFDIVPHVVPQVFDPVRSARCRSPVEHDDLIRVKIRVGAAAFFPGTLVDDGLLLGARQHVDVGLLVEIKRVRVLILDDIHVPSDVRVNRVFTVLAEISMFQPGVRS